MKPSKSLPPHAIIAAYLERNDPGPLVEALRSRREIRRSVRTFLAQLLTGHVRRPKGHPIGPGRNTVRVEGLWDRPLLDEIIKIMNKKRCNERAARAAIIEAGQFGFKSEREIERAMTRLRKEYNLPPRTRLIKFVRSPTAK